MKKLIYIFSFIFTIANVSAQMSFNNKTVSVAGWGSDENEKSATSIITNTSIDVADSMISWSIISFDLPTGWQFDFCDPYDCISNLALGASNTFKLKSTISGPLKGNFYSKNIPGNATVKIRLAYANGAHMADTITLMAKGWATGLSTVKKQAEVSFYPNPAKDLITLKYAASKPIEVTVFNVLGAKVKTFTHSGNETALNISELEKGMYFIRFNDNGNMVTKSFSKAQ
ncbi:MAG: T9SS type A sorting domain-containing protein [Bacteroidia bacterium]|nr:T9SS type A sorting domain-containing protein [Bacteroidia bacterium]MBP9688729.1 T9SS type A sorting domain-containing protein [Bacteroidia bacterium]